MMSSSLNPEAPAFYPNFEALYNEGYVCLKKSVSASQRFPRAYYYELYKKYSDFKVITNKLGNNIITESKRIILSELQTFLLSRLNNLNTDHVIDVNDSLFDKINRNMQKMDTDVDTLEGIASTSEETVQVAATSEPVLTEIKEGSTWFLGAKNIPRPQLTFKDTIDNSNRLWVPKLSDKPNSIKPLALTIIYNDEGEEIGYEHPYKVELDSYHPPAKFMEPDAEPPEFPLPPEETSLTFVTTEEQMEELVQHLLTVDELAIDVEHHSYRTYQGITCLIQISTTEGGDFIIDTLAAREHVHKLNLIFTDPKKLKVLHGAICDVQWLQRDFGVYIVGLFDTYQAAKVLNMTSLSLKSLLDQYCKVNTDKKYQLADWRIRPLPMELIHYARLDTHYLLYIWRVMKKQLLDKAGGEPNLLQAVFARSSETCATTYNKEVTEENSHLVLYHQSNKTFNCQQLAALKALYMFRDAQARELDESPRYLIPNHMLMSLAEKLPREVQGINAVCCPAPPFIKRNLITIHRMILSCREVTAEPQIFQMPDIITQLENAQQSMKSYPVHDLAHFNPEDKSSNPSFEMETDVTGSDVLKSKIPAFNPEPAGTSRAAKSILNVDAIMFIPPYERYKAYRKLAQMEELKEFRVKEAKLAVSQSETSKKEVLQTLLLNEQDKSKQSGLGTMHQDKEQPAVKRKPTKALGFDLVPRVIDDDSLDSDNTGDPATETSSDNSNNRKRKNSKCSDDDADDDKRGNKFTVVKEMYGVIYGSQDETSDPNEQGTFQKRKK